MTHDVMEIDLGRLHDMHPLLSHSTAREYAYRAAIGLDRHRHMPGVPLAVQFDGGRRKANIIWSAFPGEGGAQLDFHRVTEDTAEAVALALVHVANGWTIRRRLQRGEAADWLLIDGERNLVALEVSGVDILDTGQRRLKEKTEQVRRCGIEATKVACVMELRPPRCRTRTV